MSVSTTDNEPIYFHFLNMHVSVVSLPPPSPATVMAVSRAQMAARVAASVSSLAKKASLPAPPPLQTRHAAVFSVASTSTDGILCPDHVPSVVLASILRTGSIAPTVHPTRVLPLELHPVTVTMVTTCPAVVVTNPMIQPTRS